MHFKHWSSNLNRFILVALSLRNGTLFQSGQPPVQSIWNLIRREPMSWRNSAVFSDTHYIGEKL